MAEMTKEFNNALKIKPLIVNIGGKLEKGKRNKYVCASTVTWFQGSKVTGCFDLKYRFSDNEVAILILDTCVLYVCASTEIRLQGRMVIGYFDLNIDLDNEVVSLLSLISKSLILTLAS